MMMKERVGCDDKVGEGDEGDMKCVRRSVNVESELLE